MPANPFTAEELPGLIVWLDEFLFKDPEQEERLASTLRDYQRLLAEIPALRKDKVRLDWIESEVLRDFHDQETGEHHLRLAHDFGWVVGGMRTAIDAARSAGEG